MEVRSLNNGDYDAWLALFRCYADHYQVGLTGDSIAATWAWLNDPEHPVEGIVAEEGAALVGLAHYRAMPSPLRGRDIGFLDDLVVLPESRGNGVAEALIAEIDSIASERGWAMVRWITREDNRRARGLYDKVASGTDWKVYELTPGGGK